MEELLVDVNWLAVIVSTFVSFLVGWLWYSPKLFQTKWLEGIGISLDDNTPMAPAMVTQFVGTFLLAWLVGVAMVSEAFMTISLVCLMTAFILTANGLYSQKSTYAIVVEVTYIAVMIIIMTLTHSVF